MQGSVRMDSHAQVRTVGPCDRNCACRTQLLDTRSVLARDRVRKGRNSPGTRKARHVDVALDRDRRPVRRVEPGALGYHPVGPIRRSQGFVMQDLHDRVQLRVDGADSIQMRLHDLA